MTRTGRAASMRDMATKRPSRARTTTTTTTSAPAPRRRTGLHQVRLVLDALSTDPAAALAQLTPSQREWAQEVQKNGTTTRIVLLFPDSLHRDLDEAIRALPGGLQAGVVHASKVYA